MLPGTPFPDAITVVVAGILQREGAILICRRRADQPHALKWEFPGGKVERDETPIAALQRELQEELGADYSPQLRLAAGMLSGDAQAALPYLLFSIAKSLEDLSFLLANDSISVVSDLEDEEE